MTIMVYKAPSTCLAVLSFFLADIAKPFQNILKTGLLFLFYVLKYNELIMRVMRVAHVRKAKLNEVSRM